ncbi:hypothetical protein DQG13_01245 [Paenibacillus sp. YN15]|nr:hypothetical protein DQG13_01245 [Paenibacillus sp. YN15]
MKKTNMEVNALEHPTNGTVRHDSEDGGRPADTVPPPPAYSGFSPVEMYDTEPPRRRHSGLGIASFTIFASMALIFIIILGSITVKLSGLIDTDTGAYDYEEIERRVADMPELAFMGLALLGTLFGNFVGLILGIVGLVQKERKKVFAVLGTVLNGLVIIGLILMVLISILALASI